MKVNVGCKGCIFVISDGRPCEKCNDHSNYTNDLPKICGKPINNIDISREVNILYGVRESVTYHNPKIEKVIFNNPATVVYWSDGTKTVVKCVGEAFDEEKGLAMAISKKFLGNQGNYFNEFKKWLPKIGKPVNDICGNRKVQTTYISSEELADKMGYTKETIQKQCRKGLHPGTIKVGGKWKIPFDGMAKGEE